MFELARSMLDSHEMQFKIRFLRKLFVLCVDSFLFVYSDDIKLFSNYDILSVSHLVSE